MESDSRRAVAQRRWAEERRGRARLGLRLNPQTLTALRSEAQRTNTPMNELAESYIRAGLRQEATRVLEDTALPQLEATVQKVVAEQALHSEERIVKLLVRVLLETGVGRRLTWSFLAKAYGRDHADRVNEVAFTSSAKALQQRGWMAAVAAVSTDEAGGDG